MKKFTKNYRKGFTLVELLIVIIILGALAATMMLNSGKSVANAKASTIIANMSTIKYAAMQYYADNVNNAKLSDFKAADFLGKLGMQSGANVSYDVYDEGNGKWYVKALLLDDPDLEDVKLALAKQAKAAKILNGNRNSAYESGNDKTSLYMEIK